MCDGSVKILVKKWDFPPPRFNRVWGIFLCFNIKSQYIGVKRSSTILFTLYILKRRILYTVQSHENTDFFTKKGVAKWGCGE